MNAFRIDRTTVVDLGPVTIEVQPIRMTNGLVRARADIRVMGHFVHRSSKNYHGQVDFERNFPAQFMKMMEQLGKTLIYSKPALVKEDPSRFYVALDKEANAWVAPGPNGGTVPLTKQYRPGMELESA